MPKKKKYSLDYVKNLAREKDGSCLSKEYVNSSSKLSWKCKKGHRWEASLENINGNRSKRGTWCPYCAGKRVLGGGLGRCEEAAAKKGGKCLSLKYKNAHELLKWQCAEGHCWETSANNIIRGKWCPYCAGLKSVDGFLEECKKLATLKGGKCLSRTYKNAKNKLQWQCSEGHKWNATSENIKRGRWCPDCNIYFGEEVCRAYLEKILKIKLPKDSAVNFLVDSKFPLKELDGYNKRKKIAFEHHGEQHYKASSVHNRRKEGQFEKIKKNDKDRKRLCKLNGVKLIIIPEIPGITTLEKLPYVIQKEFKRLGIKNDFNPDNLKVDLTKYFTSKKINEFKDIAKSKNGKLHSTKYLNNSTKLEWECELGHKWSATSATIKRGSWCPKCAKKMHGQSQKSNISEMQKLAKNKNGRCISQKYVNSRTKLEWECNQGHKWKASPENIKGNRSKRGTWCPICAKNKK